jgi:heme exporter protein C
VKPEYIWKTLCIALLFYTLIAGFLLPVPELDILNETIRNLYFHVPMWFTMLALLSVSVVNSILYLSSNKLGNDRVAAATVWVSLQFGILGLLTGSIWAKFTWGRFWPPDPKLNSAAIAMLVYLAYPILRSAMTDPIQKARVSAIFNILAYPIYISLVFILPRMNASLHPGNGGNPGFNAYDLNSNMRLVFYPAVLGFILLGWWMSSQLARYSKLRSELDDLSTQ